MFGRRMRWCDSSWEQPAHWELELESPRLKVLAWPPTRDPDVTRDEWAKVLVDEHSVLRLPEDCRRYTDESTLQDLLNELEDRIYLLHRQLGRLLQGPSAGGDTE